MLNNTNLNKSLNTYFLEYELIWDGSPCASGGIQFRDSWLISQQSTCGGSFRIGTNITEQGMYKFLWYFETNGTGTANIYLDGLLYESNVITIGAGGNKVTQISFPQCGDGTPECDGEQEAPILESVQHDPNEFIPNYCNTSPKLWGGFAYNLDVNGMFYENQDMIICFDSNQDKWQYSFGEENTLKIKFGLGWCLDNIIDAYADKRIMSLPQVDYIQDGHICQAINDFEAAKTYGKLLEPTRDHYYIFEQTVLHETTHRDDFFEMLNKEYENGFWNKEHFINLDLDCSTTPTSDEVIKKVDELKMRFRRRFRYNWILKTGKKKGTSEQKAQYYLYEQETQDKVEELIDKYIARLYDRAKYLGINCN